MTYVPPQPISQHEFAEAIRQTDSTESQIALQLHDALVESRAFDTVYEATPKKYRARFLLQDGSEMVRSVLDTESRSLWISVERIDRTDWPEYRLREFWERFGIEARAGKAITQWCAENRERIDELTEWIVQHGDTGNHMELLGMSLEELRNLASRPASEESAIENRRRLAQHLTRDRDPRLRKRKKQRFELEHGYLGCEVCHLRADQPLDRSMIECHHITPLETLDQPVETRIEDLICVCANCHRRIHATKEVDRNLAILQERYGPGS